MELFRRSHLKVNITLTLSVYRAEYLDVKAEQFIVVSYSQVSSFEESHLDNTTENILFLAIKIVVANTVHSCQSYLDVSL